MRQTARARLAIIICAAGQSTRMGGQNKLLTPLAGAPLLRHSLQAFCAAKAAPLYLVTGHEADKVQSLAADVTKAMSFDIACLYNPDFAKGMGTSIACAVRQLSDHYDSVMIALGDTPHITAPIITKLIASHHRLAAHHSRITRPLYNGRPGHPVIWGRDYLAALSTLSGDKGGQSLMTKQALSLVPFDSDNSLPNPADDYDIIADFTN